MKLKTVAKNQSPLLVITLVVLGLIYLITIVSIRSAYQEPISFFNQNIKFSDNIYQNLNLEEQTDNSIITDNSTDFDSGDSTNIDDLTLTPTLSITASPVITPTGKMTVSPTPKSTTQPTTKPNTPTPTNTLTPSPTAVFDYSKPWEVSPGCPASTQRCVSCLSGESYCRVESGKTHGFKGWACQNNNPGNIRPASFKNDLIRNNGGTPPCGERSGYMVFRDYDTGKNALKAYIKAIGKGQHSAYKDEAQGIYCGECNLKFFFGKYAPSGDQNDPNSYANYVANRIEVSSDTTTLNWIINNKLDAFVDAIQVHEGWFTY